MARRGRYACAYIALDYREFFKKFGLGRIGGEGGVDWDGARGPWCGCPRGCGGSEGGRDDRGWRVRAMGLRSGQVVVFVFSFEFAVGGA